MLGETTKPVYLKCKNMMYTQQLEHLPGTLEELIEKVKQLGATYYALIVHNKDVDKDGKPVKPHIHVMLCFKNARSVNAIAKNLNDNPQQITMWKGKAENGFAYLLHHTEKSRDSYQYDSKDVIANFNYVDAMKKVEKQVASIKNNDIKFLLDLLMIGEITKADILKRLSGHEFARWHRQIEEVHAQFLRNSAEEWRRKMIAEGRKQEFVWINGPAGTGKTRLARDYAEKRGQPYFVTGSNRDPFQGYNGEHTIIIDDLRFETLEYRELLRLTDPFGMYGGMVNAPSRYSDKSLCCDLVIITSPYRSNDYYNALFGDMPKACKEIDSYKQLARRITLWLEMNEYYIHGYTYNGRNWFDQIEEKGRPNPYIQVNKTEGNTDMKDKSKKLFDSIVAKPIEDTNNSES